MNILIQPPTALPQRFLLHGVNWQIYEKALDAFGDQPIRITYDRGSLELMSPLPIHERIKHWFGAFIFALAEELDFPFEDMGHTTLRRRDRDRGLEPDDFFYLASFAKVTDWNTFNLDRDPPPDLALEVDVTTNCLDRISIYASLGVPEVWRFDGEEWHVLLLGTDGEYRESPVSSAFPYLPVTEITPLLRESLDVRDKRQRVRLLRCWARERVLPLYQAWRQQQQTPPPAAHS